MADENDTQNKPNSQSSKTWNNSLKDMAKGMGDFATLFSTTRPSLEKSIGSLNKALGIPNTGLDKFAGYLENQVKLYQDISKSGLSFNGNLQLMETTAISAGLTLDEFSKGVKANSEAMASMGMSVDKGAAIFYSSLIQMRTSNEGYATKLRMLGYNFDDFQESMARVATTQALAGASEADMQKNLARQTYEYMDNLDTLSKLTGKQKDEIEKQLKAQQNEGRFKVMMMQLQSQGAEGQRKAAELQNAYQEAALRGPQYMNAFLEGMSTGTFSKESALLMSQMGNSSQSILQLRDAAMSTNKTVADVNNARMAVEGAYIKDLQSRSNQQTALTAGFTTAGSAMNGIYTNASNSALTFGTKVDTVNTSLEEIGRLRRAEVEAAKAALTTPPKPGEEGKDEAAALRGTLAAQEKLIDIAVTTQTTAIKKLYEELATPAVVKFANALGAIDADKISASVGAAVDKFLSPGTVDQAALQNVTSQLQGMGQSGQSIASKINELKIALNQASDPQVQRDLINQLTEQLNAAKTAGATGTDTVVKRDTGSIGKTGGILENFGKGTPAILHGREAVLTEEQLTNLAKGLQGEGAKAMAAIRPQMEGMANQLRPQMQNIAKTVAPQMQNMAKTMAPQLQGMLNNIRPQMQNLSQQVAPQMQNIAEQMAPMMKQMAEQMQGPMKEMAEQMKGPMESMAGNMQKSLGVATKQLRTQKGLSGNLFKGLGI